MKRYQNVSDEDLIDLIHQGNVKASEILFSRYHYYSWRVGYEFDMQHPDSGISLEDYRQVAFSMIPVCLKKYLNSGSGFYIYWKTCCMNELMDYFLENSYSAKAQVYKGLPLDDDRYSVVAEEIGEIDFEATRQILGQEIELIKEKIISNFSQENDKSIINLFISGMSFEEIQGKTGEKSRHIYYVIDKFQSLIDKEIKKRNYK